MSCAIAQLFSFDVIELLWVLYHIEIKETGILTDISSEFILKGENH